MLKSLILFALLVAPASATVMGLTSVKQPVFLLESDEEMRIRIIDVPFVTAWADPEWRFSAIGKPFIPATDDSWREPGDVNLTSLCRIKVSGTYKQDSEDVEVIIDASKAAVPDGYPFTLDQVLDAVTTCVKLMYPPRPEDEGKLEIKVVPPKTTPAESD